MRKLIYVPIIHGGTDMGSIASALEAKGVAMIGEDSWERHKGAISGFWKSITEYFKPLDVKGFQIYQDGLLADDELGMKIVNSAAAKGSKNYQLVKYLVARGARIMKTEDVAIVKKEAEVVKNIANSSSKLKKLANVLRYKIIKKKLLKERDKFIAERINNTLGEKGIIFIGAYHNVIPLLDKDIVIKQIKERDKVEEYQKIFFLKSEDDRAEKLAGYLVAAVD